MHGELTAVAAAAIFNIISARPTMSSMLTVASTATSIGSFIFTNARLPSALQSHIVPFKSHSYDDIYIQD